MSPPSIRRALVGACAPFMRLPLGTRLALAALAACCTLRGGGKGAGARADAPPMWLHSPSWDVVRLPGRGLDAPLGSFSVAVTPDGTTFFVR